MDLITTITQAHELLAVWREEARTAPQRGPQASVRRRVRDLELLLSITSKRVHEAQRAVSDLEFWLSSQTSEAAGDAQRH